MTVVVRESVKPLVERIGNYFIAYQGWYGEVDNVVYFANQWIPGVRHAERIAHRPDDYYLAGRVTG